MCAVTANCWDTCCVLHQMEALELWAWLPSRFIPHVLSLCGFCSGFFRYHKSYSCEIMLSPGSFRVEPRLAMETHASVRMTGGHSNPHPCSPAAALQRGSRPQEFQQKSFLMHNISSDRLSICDWSQINPQPTPHPGSCQGPSTGRCCSHPYPFSQRMGSIALKHRKPMEETRRAKALVEE